MRAVRRKPSRPPRRAVHPAAAGATVQPVAQVRREVVSRLAAPMPDSVFVAEFTKPPQLGIQYCGG